MLAAAFADRAAEHDAGGRFPTADVDDLRAAGMLGLMVPARLGGAGAGFGGYTAVATELAGGAGATALLFNMHASVTGALASTSDDLARRGHPLERIFRDARCGALQPATSDVCADWLGAAALGGDPHTAAVPRW